MSELRECPFCGGRNLDTRGPAVVCNDCFCAGPCVDDDAYWSWDGLSGSRSDEAIDAIRVEAGRRWNQRVTPEALARTVDKIMEDIQCTNDTSGPGPSTSLPNP